MHQKRHFILVGRRKNSIGPDKFLRIRISNHDLSHSCFSRTFSLWNDAVVASRLRIGIGDDLTSGPPKVERRRSWVWLVCRASTNISRSETIHLQMERWTKAREKGETVMAVPSKWIAADCSNRVSWSSCVSHLALTWFMESNATTSTIVDAVAAIGSESVRDVSPVFQIARRTAEQRRWEDEAYPLDKVANVTINRRQSPKRHDRGSCCQDQVAPKGGTRYIFLHGKHSHVSHVVQGVPVIAARETCSAWWFHESNEFVNSRSFFTLSLLVDYSVIWLGQKIISS